MEPSKLAIKLSGFIPMMFDCTCEVGQDLGAEGRAQVAINDRPFILQKVKHQIIPAELNPQAGAWVYQDGLYTIDWSLYEQSRYWKGVPPMADTAFGSIRHGIWSPLPAPVSLPGNETLHVIVRNAVAREAGIKVFVLFEGIQRGGSQSQIGD